MHFVPGSECKKFFKKLGVDDGELISGSRAAVRLKTFDIYYKSRLANARDVSQALASHQGNFSTCQLWAYGLVFGDLSLNEPPPPDWAEYRRWRLAQGEKRSLYEAPGHVFERGEHHALTAVIQWAIYMSWDTLIASKPTKIMIYLSHDDRITILARSRPSALIADLTALGLETRQRGL